MSELISKFTLKQFFNFPLFVGLRYIGSARLNLFISFVSLASAVGLTLGVSVLILVMSVMNGFEHELHHRILGMVSHVVVEPANNKRDDNVMPRINHIGEWEKVIGDIQSQSGVQAAAPSINISGMLSNEGDMIGIEVLGIDPELEKRVSIYSDYMVVGQTDNLQKGLNRIIIGSITAGRLNLAPGDSVTFIYPEPSGNNLSVIPRFHRFIVSGIFQVGSEYDGLVGAIHLEDAASMLNMGADVSSIRIKVDDIFQAPLVADQLRYILSDSYQVSDWTVNQGGFFQAVALEKAMMAFLLMLIVAVAAFNIISSLVMMVSDKNMDIAVLRTLGASPGQVTMIFILQGLFVGFIGVATGIILGVLASIFIDDGLSLLESLLGIKLFDAYFIDYLPTKLVLNDVLLIAISGIIISFMATIYPARKAAEIKPAEALRYE